MLRIPKFTISLSDAFDSANEVELIKVGLDLEGLLGNEFLYTIIDGERIGLFLKKGTYRKGSEIYAFTCNELGLSDVGEFDISSALSSYTNPALIVYDKFKFDPISYWTYEFIDPKNKLDAVKAWIKLEY